MASLCEKRWFHIIFAYYARWLHTFTSSISRFVNRSIANRSGFKIIQMLFKVLRLLTVALRMERFMKGNV